MKLKRAKLLTIAAVMAVATPFSLASTVLADRYDDQLGSLRSAASQYQAQADQLRQQADTLQNKLDQITAQKNALEAQIAINTTRHDQLLAEITATEEKISDNQAALGKLLANLYVDDDVSTIELLAGSHSIGDYVNRQEYRSSVRDQLSKTIDTVKKLKKKLDDDKAALEQVLAELDAQNKQLAAAQSEQQRLVEQTRGEEASYQQLVASVKTQMDAVASQQRAYYQSLMARGRVDSGVVGSFQYSNWSGNMGCSGGYAYCGGQDTYADPWGLYNRECVSYVAWALVNRFGKYVGHFSGQGNAMDWPYSASSYSGAVRVSSPQPGDAVILPAMSGFAPIGHAMLVESVSGDTIHVSQYNFYGTGEYSTMDIKNSGIILLRFRDR